MAERGDGFDNINSTRQMRGTVQFRPSPIEQIYARNTITPQELTKLRAGEEHKPIRHLPPRFELLAAKSAEPMPSQIEEWLNHYQEPRPWLVICESNAYTADVIAGRILLDHRLDCYHEGALLHVVEFAEKCNGASKFGSNSVGNIIADVAGHKLLVITGIGARDMPSSAPLAYELMRLFARRLDRLLPTVLVERSPGPIWLNELRKAGASVANVNQLSDIIKLGMEL